MNKNFYLYQLLEKSFISQIIMHKTWDNSQCRHVCIEILKQITNMNLNNNSTSNLASMYNDPNYITNSLKGIILKDFLQLKEFCEYECIHRDFDKLINSIIDMCKNSGMEL